MATKGSKRTFGHTWWTFQLIAMAEALTSGTRAASARTYARQDRVAEWRLSPGRIDSLVQGKEPWPYEVAIRIRPWPQDVIDKLAGWLREDRLMALQIAGGDLPEAFDAALKGLGTSLFPPKPQTYREAPGLTCECSCLDFTNACKHALATLYVVSEELDRNPALLLRWRGLLESQWLTDTGKSRPSQPEQNVGFYCSGAALEPGWLPPPTDDPALLLRTLGPLPLKAGKDTLDKPLAEAYRLLAEDANAWLERFSTNP